MNKKLGFGMKMKGHPSKQEILGKELFASRKGDFRRRQIIETTISQIAK